MHRFEQCIPHGEKNPYQAHLLKQRLLRNTRAPGRDCGSVEISEERVLKKEEITSPLFNKEFATHLAVGAGNQSFSILQTENTNHSKSKERNHLPHVILLLLLGQILNLKTPPNPPRIRIPSNGGVLRYCGPCVNAFSILRANTQANR